jgi:diguanylate cyclase (GGDEF)-like protein
VAGPPDRGLLRPARDDRDRRLRRRRAHERARGDAIGRGQRRPLGRRRRVGRDRRCGGPHAGGAQRAPRARPQAEARVDALTGLLNRRGFEERLAVETARAARDGAGAAIVAFDLDHFKSVNDERGHEAGDRALATLGAVIREHARAGDLTARWGGEEFFVVMPGAGAVAARRLAERVRAAFAATGLDVTASAGVGVADAPFDPHALMASADAALYEAKRAGRDRTVIAAAPVAS